MNSVYYQNYLIQGRRDICLFMMPNILLKQKKKNDKKIKGINTHENNERHIYYEVMKSFPHFALCAISNIKMHSAMRNK